MKGCPPGFLVLHYCLKFAQAHIHWVANAIQPSHPLLPLSPPVFNLSPTSGSLPSEQALRIRCLPWHLLQWQMLAAKIPSVLQLAVCPLTRWGTWSFWRNGPQEAQSSWTIAHLTPPSIGFSRQEYWSGLPFPSQGDLPDPGIKLGSLALQTDPFIIWATREPTRKPSYGKQRTCSTIDSQRLSVTAPVLMGEQSYPNWCWNTFRIFLD